MPNEASKARPRLQRYLQGHILDIGAGPDPITPDAQVWEIGDGDAQLLDTIPNQTFDTVFSAHCLEHMRNPMEALMNWWRVLKPGGHLIVLVPEEDLYEQHWWPSLFNDDHKIGLTAHKDASWHPASYNILDIVKHLYHHKLISLTIQDTGYDHTAGPARDQTQGPAEAAVELVVRKQTLEDGIRNAALDHCIWCRACNGQMILHGLYHDGKARCQCSKCGEVVQINIKELLGL